MERKRRERGKKRSHRPETGRRKYHEEEEHEGVKKPPVDRSISSRFDVPCHGVFFVVMGFEAKSTIRTALAEENVTTSKDAVEFGVPGGVLVDDARTAEAQAAVIKKHSIDRYGLYSEMERDDPNRATYIKGLTLRNSLNLSVLGFGVADLAIGTGAMIIVLGIGTMSLGALALHNLTATEAELAGLKRGPPTEAAAMG